MGELMELIIVIIGLITGIMTIIKTIFVMRKWHKNKPKKILFIDDEIDDFEIVKTLRKNNYQIDTLNDLENLENDIVKNAKIIFVDFKGVGKKFGNQQGIDLIKALKKKYKKKKTIILFSAHNFSLTKEIDAGDNRIAKNAPLQDFVDMIEKYK